VVRGWLGIDTQDLDPSLRRYFGVDRGGALILEVSEPGPAARSGLHRGDVVVSLDGQPVRSSRQLKQAAGRHQEGSQVTLEVMRDRRPQKVSLHVSQHPAPPLAEPIARRKIVGIHGVPLSPALAELLEMPSRPGLLVLKVELGSLAFDAGIHPGELVVEANQQPVHSPEDLDNVLRSVNGSRRPIVLLVQGKESSRYVALDPLGPPRAL
jgi:serine protease Do